MARNLAIPAWIRRSREERLMSREELGAVFGVPADQVKAWEEGTPVPEPHLFPLVRWLETGYVPDAGDAVPTRDAYPWVTDPRA